MKRWGPYTHSFWACFHSYCSSKLLTCGYVRISPQQKNAETTGLWLSSACPVCKLWEGTGSRHKALWRHMGVCLEGWNPLSELGFSKSLVGTWISQECQERMIQCVQQQLCLHIELSSFRLQKRKMLEANLNISPCSGKVHSWFLSLSVLCIVPFHSLFFHLFLQTSGSVFVGCCGYRGKPDSDRP